MPMKILFKTLSELLFDKDKDSFILKNLTLPLGID
jgi:hypothetical protein